MRILVQVATASCSVVGCLKISSQRSEVTLKTTTLHSVRKDYQVTLIDTGNLRQRLATELRYFESELRRTWPNLKRDPVGFSKALAFDCVAVLKRSLSAPSVSVGILTAFLVLTLIPLAVHVVERRGGSSPHATPSNEQELAPDVVTLDL